MKDRCIDYWTPERQSFSVNKVHFVWSLRGLWQCYSSLPVFSSESRAGLMLILPPPPPYPHDSHESGNYSVCFGHGWTSTLCLVRCDNHESGTWLLCFSRGWTSSVRSGVTAIRVVHDCCVCFSRGWTTNTRCLAGWWRAWRWRRTSATSRCTPRPTSRMTTFASSISPSNDWWQHQNTGRRINFSCVSILNSTVASVALCVICLDSQQNLGDLTIMENIVELANTSV